MPEINLDDLQDDLISNEGLTNEIVDAPFIDSDIEEQDNVNLYDMSPDIYENPHTGNITNTDNNVVTSGEVDIITDLLKSKGIEDPLLINFEDEDGSIKQKSFYELPYEEQLNILASNDADIDYELNDSESQAVSFLRENNVTLEETVEYFQRKAVEDYINSQNIVGLEVDQYSNEELYLLHLKNEYPDLTDEEITLSLEKQQEHPDLFKKQVDKLRGDYKDVEKKQIEDARLEITQAEDAKRRELEETLIDVATTIKDIGGLTLDDNDRNQVLDHILNKDMQGISPLIKSLNSPERLFQLAWWAVKGEEAFNILHDHYKKEIAQVSKSAFEKGKQSVVGFTEPSQTSNKKSYTRRNTNVDTRLSSPTIPKGTDGMSINDITID